ncbi:MAG: ribosome biogenesis GTP-binding protein YihA/YsxC [Alphaproteobacteria bacterium]|nr:ribosome biogenesis GTP-binding protein YihA/YsxC [Alphaproteobacteria bacterium]
MTNLKNAEEKADFPRKLFAGACDFMLGAAQLSQLPSADLPEIAFAGRSNVGKSSLVNALTGRKTLAKTSHTPGRTQQLNFFNLGQRLYMVDLPGYGYAKVSKSQKKEWDTLIRDYLRGRPSLRCVFILVDSRHGLKESDRELMAMLDQAGVSYRIVLTKTDKTKTQDLEKVITAAAADIKSRAAAFPEILMTSSHMLTGLDRLKELIAGILDSP